MYVGAKSGSVYAGKEIGRTALLSGIATLTLGNYGKVVLGLLVASACLTTSVGLAATAGNFFEKHIKIKYEVVVIASSVISLFISVLGVDKIIKIAIASNGSIQECKLQPLYPNHKKDQFQFVAFSYSQYSSSSIQPVEHHV